MYFDFPNETFKNKSVLFFYKGTAHPRMVDAPDWENTMMKQANNMILCGLRNGVSLEEQKKDYKEQMDMMEQTLCDTAQDKMMDEDILNRSANQLEISVDRFYSTWCLNICALLKMNVIKDDNNNGIMSGF